MSLAYADIDDAVLLTQQNLIKRGAFLDLQTDLQDFVAVRELWRTRKKVFNGGDDWEWQAQIDHNHSARAVGLYETDGSAIMDTMIRGRVQPRHVNAHYTYELHEPSFQKGGVTIVDLVKTRYIAMMFSWYSKVEEFLWSKPATSADKRTPYGVTYWVIKNATEGFNGENPAGFTLGRGSIDSTVYGRWANWADDYTAVSKEELLRKMRKGHRQTKFRSPISHATPTLGAMRNGIYTTDSVIGLMEELVEQQNMNLGNDLASKDGRANFKSTPITWVPQLDIDTQNPVYMLDWNWFAIGVLAGWENQMTKPYQVPDMHNVRRVDLDASFQMICTNLRRQAVFHNAG